MLNKGTPRTVWATCFEGHQSCFSVRTFSQPLEGVQVRVEKLNLNTVTCWRGRSSASHQISPLSMLAVEPSVLQQRPGISDLSDVVVDAEKG